MKVINNSMIQPIQQTTDYDKNHITLTAYHETYKIHNYKELIEFIYTHKHNYKPLIGKINVKYNFHTDIGRIMLFHFISDINRKEKGKIEYQYKVTTYDQYGKEYVDRFTIPVSKAIKCYFTSKYRKEVYEIMWRIKLNEMKVFDEDVRGLHALELWDIETDLYELNEHYQKKLPLSIKNRKELYWQPEGI